MGCRRQEEEVRRLTRETFAELIPLRSLNFVAVLIGCHLMRLVNDNQIEMRICDGNSDVILPREIHRGDQLGLPMPDVFLRMRRDVGTRDVCETLLKPIFQLVYPLHNEVPGCDNQDALRLIAEFELLRDEPRHNRLASTRVIGDEKADARLL